MIRRKNERVSRKRSRRRRWTWRGTIVYVDVGLTACVQNAVNFLMLRIEWSVEVVVT